MPATPAWPPKSAPRLFVPPPLADDATVTLDGPQAHYLASVMRVTPGDAVMLMDDATGEWLARVTDAGKRRVTLTIERRMREREAVPDFELVCAPLRKPHFDLVLEKATELGVARIRPVLTRRSVVDRVNPDRMLTIVTEAAEQCARTALPALDPLARLDAVLREWPTDRALFFADENGGAPAATAFAARPGPAALLVGPEGGFDDAEREAVRALPQAVPVSLGPRILRGETAAIAGCALWMATCGDWR